MALVSEKLLLHKLKVPNCMVFTLGVLPHFDGHSPYIGCFNYIEITTTTENSSQETMVSFN